MEMLAHKIVDIFKQFTEREGDIIKNTIHQIHTVEFFFLKCMKSLELWNIIFVDFDHSNNI